MLIFATPISSTTSSSWIGAYIVAAIAGLRFSWVNSHQIRHLFEASSWIFIYIFLGIAPLVQLRLQIDPSTTQHINHDYDWIALAVVVASELALIFGSGLARSVKVNSLVKPSRVLDLRRTFNINLVLIAASSLFVALTGLDVLFSNRLIRDVLFSQILQDDVVRTIVNATISLGLLVSAVAMIHLFRAGFKQGRTKMQIWLSIILLLLIVNPIGSPRYLFMTVVLGLASSVGLYGSIRKFRLASLGALLGMLFIFPILDIFRVSFNPDVQSFNLVANLFDGDFDSFAQILNTSWFVDLHGVTWGLQFIGVIFFWVPRTIWPSKPFDTGSLLAQAKGYSFENLSAPLPAEFFINFGWIGVLLGMAFVGYKLRQTDIAFESHLQEFGIPTVLGSILPWYSLLIWRGSLLQATANLAVIVFFWRAVSIRESKHEKPGSLARR